VNAAIQANDADPSMLYYDNHGQQQGDQYNSNAMAIDALLNNLG
jgi:hypothetical protein